MCFIKNLVMSSNRMIRLILIAALLYRCLQSLINHSNVLDELERLLSAGQVKSDCFIRNLVAFSNQITRLTAILLCGCLQGLINLDLWPTTARIDIDGQISRPKLLEQKDFPQMLDVFDNLIQPRISYFKVKKADNAE